MNNHNITAGTPRGFNLANMPLMTTFPPGFPPPSSLPPFPAAFGNHTVQPPTGWPGSTPFLANGDDPHQPGPLRRGGARFNNTTRPGGPYDRRQAPRYGGIGRLTPPRNGVTGDRPIRVGAGGIVGGAGKWGDGAGAQTVGPREAVQGRSLKSYEDLDAVGASAGGELNY